MKQLKTLLSPALLMMTLFSATLFSIAPVRAASQPSQAPGVGIPSFPANGLLASLPASNWVALGPQPINSASNLANCQCLDHGLNSGRITALAVNPTNSNDVWAGAADGGVWHSTDGGAHWSPVTDNQPTLSIGSIAIDPNNPNVIYVGTGEANQNSDAYWGAGVLKSTDGGAHWTQLGFSQFGGLGIAKIAVDPHNSSNILVAAGISSGLNGYTAPSGVTNFHANPGIWRSIDGGVNWTEVKSDPANTYIVNPDSGTDLVFDPAHTGVVFAGVGDILGLNPRVFSSIAGVYKSINGGATWTLLTNGIPAGNSIEHVSLGISQDGQHIYAVLTDAGSVAGGAFYGDLLNSAIYVSSTNGSSWTAKDVSNVPGMVNDGGTQQWWYTTYAAVDPTDSTGNTAYVGGGDIWQTTDGGTTWANLTTTSSGGSIYPNQHALAFLGNTSSSYYLGNDGGIWRGTATGVFTNLNGGGLNITQFYSGSIGEVGPDAQVYGGTQGTGLAQLPAGSPLTNTAQWNEPFGGNPGQAFGGDVGAAIVDYTNNAVVYEVPSSGGVMMSSDGGVTWAPIWSSQGSSFSTPFIISPNNHNELFVADGDVVLETTNPAGGQLSWITISPNLNGGTYLTTLAIAPGNDNYIYAGSGDGNIYMTAQGSSNFPSWSGGPVPGSMGRRVTGLAVDPTNPNVVYATFASFATGAGHHVFKSTDGAKTWTDISASLPDIPFESVQVSPTNPNLVIVGSDVGIFASQNGGSSWAKLGSGLPNVAVDQVFFDHDGTRVFVATHGRGMWMLPIGNFQVDPSAVNLTTTPGSSPSQQTITLSNTGMGNLPWSSNGLSLPSWVSVSPTSGTIPAGGTQTLTLTFNTPSTTPQTLTTNLVLSAPVVSSSPITVPITVVSANVSKTWYFAEGFTGTGFTEYLTLANPNSDQNGNLVTVQYLLQGAPPVTKQFTLAPNSRTTINVNNSQQGVGPGQNVSVVITGTLPLIAERPMYFQFGTIPGGSDVLGATSLSQDFDFGYLDTTPNHSTYLTILNPDPNTDMDVQISYFPAAGGDPIVVHQIVPKNSRGTIKVNTQPLPQGGTLPPGTYSALVHLSLPGLVERPLYLKDATTGFTGAGDVVGVANPLTDWDFAEGFVSSTFSERYILSNPSTTDTATGTVTFFLATGAPVTTNFTLAPGQQKIILVNSLLTGNNSAHIHADHVILAERFMSFKFGANIFGATDVLGAAAPSNLFYFAEGFTGKGFSEYLTIENPSTTDTATVQVTFLPTTGAPIVRVYTIAPSSRFTLNTASVVPGASFSMVVESNVAIVAERPMYFLFGTSITGGSDVVGYQP